MNAPRVLVAGLSGGGGKTLVSVGLTAAWARRARTVAAFKKGPDYIDAAWLSQAAGAPCRNLDLFLMSGDAIMRSFTTWSGAADVAVVEGNRGLFDGTDARGSFSTAELSKLLKAPVVLVVDATKRTRTAAALVLGCQRLDRHVPLRGVVLNRVAGARHLSVLREAIEDACGVPVLGAIPKLAEDPFPQRHLGLVPPVESEDGRAAVARAAAIAEAHLDLDALWRVAHDAPPLATPALDAVLPDGPAPSNGEREAVRIGVFRDAAFQFYYPENLEALERSGATLTWISPLADERLPDVDALYIGGGFPETLADRLASNVSFRESVREAVEDGLPVYAECGGAVYLGEKLVVDERQIPMSSAVPAVYGFGARPNGHGYTVVETVKPNPFYPVGTELTGHEFHYTFLRSVIAEHVTFALRIRKGHGFDGLRDGLCYRNVLACYTHVHALGTDLWAPALVRAAAMRRSERSEAEALAPGETGR